MYHLKTMYIFLSSIITITYGYRSKIQRTLKFFMSIQVIKSSYIDIYLVMAPIWLN